MEELQKAAKVAFATSFAFYLKAHNYHWNVEGSDFKQYHDLFGGIYDEVYGSIDDFAEKIRALGTYVPASLEAFSMLSRIEDENNLPSPMEMIAELLEDNNKIIKILKIVFQTSEQAVEPGFSDFIAGRIDAHAKHGWMLRASLKGLE